ncbi:hypothetical protein MINT15_35740 [Saccharomonospora viridis]|uniref:Uncharacterized protein n=1 Tax=Saccharomonospora viridis TaxID=1852 RepID=A0A837D7E2_9PSEU|nr:hypothetical protein MINT15_35740 [Saccharomonospora viridis]
MVRAGGITGHHVLPHVMTSEAARPPPAPRLFPEGGHCGVPTGTSVIN